MKKGFFVITLLPLLAAAQEDRLPGLIEGKIKDSTAAFISLPDPYRSDFYKYFEVGRFSTYKYSIGHDSVYYKIFSRYHKDSLPVIDFSKNDLVVGVFCSQCVATCRHLGERGNEPCHRNACRYKFIWYLGKKQTNL